MSFCNKLSYHREFDTIFFKENEEHIKTLLNKWDKEIKTMKEELDDEMDDEMDRLSISKEIEIFPFHRLDFMDLPLKTNLHSKFHF